MSSFQVSYICTASTCSTTEHRYIALWADCLQSGTGISCGTAATFSQRVQLACLHQAWACSSVYSCTVHARHQSQFNLDSVQSSTLTMFRIQVSTMSQADKGDGKLSHTSVNASTTQHSLVGCNASKLLFPQLMQH